MSYRYTGEIESWETWFGMRHLSVFALIQKILLMGGDVLFLSRGVTALLKALKSGLAGSECGAQKHAAVLPGLKNRTKSQPAASICTHLEI